MMGAKEATMKRFALFGNPVGHSLSPLMMNAAFGAMGIRADYESHRVENLELAVRMIRERPLDGVSVTLPLKGAVMAFLDEVDDDARAIGAVNTVTNDHGRLRGSNTDWTGITAAVQEHFPLEGRTVAVLGAGGAARAAVYAILRAGGTPIVFNRSRDRAESLARWFSCGTQPLANLGRTEADVLINATPVGMYPNPPWTGVTWPGSSGSWRRSTTPSRRACSGRPAPRAAVSSRGSPCSSARGRSRSAPGRGSSPRSS